MPLSPSPWTIIRWNDLKSNPSSLFALPMDLGNERILGQTKNLKKYSNVIGFPVCKYNLPLSNSDLPEIQHHMLPKQNLMREQIRQGKHVIWPQQGINSPDFELEKEAAFIHSFYQGIKLQLMQLSHQYNTIEEIK